MECAFWGRIFKNYQQILSFFFKRYFYFFLPYKSSVDLYFMQMEKEWKLLLINITCHYIFVEQKNFCFFKHLRNYFSHMLLVKLYSSMVLHFYLLLFDNLAEGDLSRKGRYSFFGSIVSFVRLKRPFSNNSV